MLKREKSAWCPSSRPTLSGALAFGVVRASKDGSLTSYLNRAIPAEEVVGEFDRVHGRTGVAVTEVVRFTSPCATTQCRHFDGGTCSLAKRVTENLAPVVDTLPACAIRSCCLWWNQEGKAACFRCPRVRTDDRSAPEAMRRISNPPVHARN
jgi:hypothetical protein